MPKQQQRAVEMTFKPNPEPERKSHTESHRGSNNAVRYEVSPRSEQEIVDRKNSQSCKYSQCSECSGAAKKGMEYICVNCMNKEMMENKRRRREHERDEDYNYDIIQKKKLDDAQEKYKQELIDLKRKMKNDMDEQLMRSSDRRKLDEVEKYFQI